VKPFVVLAAAVVLTGTAAAQSFAPQPQLYLLSVDAADARAIWLQPAALVRRQEASIGAFGTMRQDGESGVTQYGINLASRGFAIAWQRYPGISGAAVSTLSLAFAVGGERMGFGVTRSWLRGPASQGTGLDVGARVTLAPPLELSFVARDIGTPTVLGQVVSPTLLPAASFNIGQGRARLSAEWELVARDRGTSAVRGALSVALPASFQLSAHGEFSGSFEYRSLTVSLGWNGARMVRAATFYRDAANGSDPVGAWAALVQNLARPRPRFGGI